MSLGIAPYDYIAYSGSLVETAHATGVKNYFVAFVVGHDGCNPSWGGDSSGMLGQKRAQDIKADIMALRDSGGRDVLSFGGASGKELAVTCQTPAELAGAYQRTISFYDARRVDFDIEGQALTDKAAAGRRAAAIQLLRRSNPNLQVWVTLPVHAGGLTADGQYMLSQLIERQVTLSGINIMAMNYNAHTRDMGQRATQAAEAAVAQLRKLYPREQESTIWKSLMVTVMAGHNDTPGEIFTLQNARTVHNFALKKGVGTISLWNVARDTPCVDPSIPQPSVVCSGVPQQPYAFIRALSMPVHQ